MVELVTKQPHGKGIFVRDGAKGDKVQIGWFKHATNCSLNNFCEEVSEETSIKYTGLIKNGA
jgi:hypothetical protein